MTLNSLCTEKTRLACVMNALGAVVVCLVGAMSASAGEEHGAWLNLDRLPRPGEKDVPGEGRPYPEAAAWRHGEMELHFIYTGRGENAFYILPDGTTVVNDVGDLYVYDKEGRPTQLDQIPWRPRADLLGGECVSRYIQKLVKTRKLDYLLLSHWHEDHCGATWLRAKTTADGRRVSGMALLGEDFDFGAFYDNQYPEDDKYLSRDDSKVRAQMADFLAREQAKGMRREPFRVGAKNQICLRHDPDGEFAKSFSIRNIAANGAVWTGKGEESKNYADAHFKANGGKRISQNELSMAIRIDYGRFSFLTGGDLNQNFLDEKGEKYSWEGVYGRAAGKVNVCKSNHHGSWRSMNREFLEAVRADVYVSCVWHQRQVNYGNMPDLASADFTPGGALVCPTTVPEWARIQAPAASWWKNVAPEGHVVVKVAPGGGSYRVYILDSATEDMLIKYVYQSKPL